MSLESTNNPGRRHGAASSPQGVTAAAPRAETNQVASLVVSWLAVGLPLAWGVWQTLQKALTLFQ